MEFKLLMYKVTEYLQVNISDLLGDPELLSAAVPTSPPEQPQGVHQEGSMLDDLQHHCRESSTNTGVFVWEMFTHRGYKVASSIFFWGEFYAFCDRNSEGRQEMWDLQLRAFMWYAP